MKAKSLEALKVEYGDLVNQYHDIEALLPEVKQIPSFLVQLHTASSLTGTRITAIEPQTIKSEDFYNVVSFNVEMEGTYHDFGSFIGYVANFPFITNVSDVEIDALSISVGKAKKTDRNSGIYEDNKDKTIKAKFNLATYYVKEDERLQELVL